MTAFNCRHHRTTNKLENGLRCPSIHEDALATTVCGTCCDLDLQNLIRSSVGASKNSLSVLSKLFKQGCLTASKLRVTVIAQLDALLKWHMVIYIAARTAANYFLGVSCGKFVYEHMLIVCQ